MILITYIIINIFLCKIFILTPSSKGVSECNSRGTASSAASRSGSSELAAALGSSAYELKPGFIYEIKIKLIKFII